MKIYNEIFKINNLPHEYIPYEIPRISEKPNIYEFRKFLNIFDKNHNYSSAVISDPYKKVAIDSIEFLSKKAKEIGAVNLVYKSEKRLVGDNIDGDAFINGFQKEKPINFKNLSVSFFGTGGVSSAVAFTLLPYCKKIGLVSNDIKNSYRLAELLVKHNPFIKIEVLDKENRKDLRKYDILYNGTGLGKYSYDSKSLSLSPLTERDLLPTTGIAIDANYTPQKTKFLKQCEERGLTIHNGFSHMISFISLHLKTTIGYSTDYSSVKEIGEKYYQKIIK